MEDLNNFHGFLPGGMYRSPDKLDTPLPYDNKKITRRDVVDAIDVFIAETGFDTGRYLRLSGIVDKCINQIVEASRTKNWDRADHYVARGERIKSAYYEMKKPVYDHLISIGFPRIALIQ